MNMGLPWIVWYMISVAVVADGKVFKPVELAQKLHSLNISDWDIPSLVCIAHNASKLDTSHVDALSLSQVERVETFYGIFGIPEGWLDGCGLHHTDVTDDVIDDDIKCVLSHLNIRFLLFDRTDSLAVLTPHIVDLNKCFDWWEHLPHYILSTNEHFEVPICDPSTTPTTISSDTGHSTPSRKPHPPVTTTCKCDSNSGSFIVDFSLMFLNIILVAMCYILWVSFVQRRTVKSDSVQFI